MSHYSKNLIDIAKGCIKKSESTIDSCQNFIASCSAGGRVIEECSADAGKVIAQVKDCSKICDSLKNLADEHFLVCNDSECRSLLDDCYESCNDVATLSTEVVAEIREADADESLDLCTECIELCTRCSESCQRLINKA